MHEGIERFSRVYYPFAQQEIFHRSPAKYRFFGGAAGPGKSKALLMEAILQAHDAPNVNTLLMRRTYPELEASLLLYFRRDIPRELYKSFNDSKHIVTWHNGSTTRFGYSKSENDIYQYQGAELLFIGIDELTLFTLKQWQFLTSRNRCPVPGTFANMAGAGNPGNIGHVWVKALWVDKQPAPGMTVAEYDPNDYEYIPAKVFDNPIYANDTAYIKTLHSLPDALRRAFLEGDWNVLAGQYFDIFDQATQTYRDTDEDAPTIDYWRPRWVSMDWGFEHECSVGWHAQLGDEVVTYREKVDRHLGAVEWAQIIVDMSVMTVNGERKPEKISAIYLSPDAFAKRTSEHTVAEQFGDELVKHGLPRPTPADNDRVGGWRLMYEMLKNGQWRISQNCPRLIQTLTMLIRDMDHDPEDVLKVDGDDSADQARYGLKSYLRPRQAPLEVRIAERVTATDPTARAMQARIANIDERKKTAPHRMHRFGRFRGK
jgi:phage terminase large subunit